MTTIGKTNTTRTQGPQGLDQATWASSIKNTARSLELGMKTLQSLIQPDGKAPGGLYSATASALHEGVDLLNTLLEKRFDTKMSKGALGMLGVAQRALDRADSHFRKMDQQIDAARLPPGAQPIKSDYFGHVDNAAAKLVAAANSTGKPAYVDFNGTNLIAMPGSKATDVVKDWSAAMGAIKNPLGDLSYKVETRAEDEAARNTLLTLSKQPPRPLGNIMQALEAKVSAGEYGFAMMAGLCELQHPKEIKAFIEHVLENPPKKDPAQSTDAARTIARDNITFWVRDRGGAQRGTESTWLNTLADVEKARANGGGKPQSLDATSKAGGAGGNKARGINDILGDLNKLVDKKVYSHDFMAGLCELKTPGDIKTFLEHFMDNPPKKDAAQSTNDARSIMMKNVTFWARDREGTAPGTKDTWLSTLADVAKSKAPIPFESINYGGQISDSVKDMLVVANRPENKGRSVVATMNGHEFTAKAGDTVDSVMAPFNAKMEEGRKQYALQQEAAAKARASRLEGAVSSGLKITETPPPGMTFDTRGLLQPGGMYNSKGTRPLQLITEAQLKQLPDGTQLTSITGEKAIKGFDNIDLDTRGGFIAFGFQQ
jgi:hypothetical protein